ncbi:hypothetical protein F5141DRAFT_1208413 [Pisolithus sp. B1]|nr:hypothetical protein F5141DRAFT_1208413 [Pisolithus sp. B1]
MDNEDGSKSNNKEGSKEGSKGSTEGSDYAENKESLSDCKEGGDTCAPNARPASGVRSPLPPSSPLADWTDDSGPDAEETVASPHQGRQTYQRLQKKGKGRALDTEDVDLADHSDHEMPPPYLKKLGNLSKVALEEIWAFVWDVKTTAQELGQWHSDLTSISVNRDTLNNLITKEYNTLMQDIPKDDLAMRREKLQAVYEWSESSSVIPANRSVKSIAARVNSAKTQFSGLAKVWSNLEDIEIIGVVMYIGQDPAGHQTSASMSRHSWTSILQFSIKCLRNGDGTEAGLLSTGSAGDAAIALELHCHIKETPRDCNCRVFGSMMKEKLLAALKDLCLTHRIEVSDPQKVTWHWLLKFMWKYHLTIVNWPCGVSPPGPGFDHKKLKAGPLCQLVVPYLLRKLGHMYDGQTDDEEEQDSLDDVPKIEINFFADIIDIPDENPLKSEIPLVKAADGTILWKISDDPEWQKSCQERDCQRQDTEACWQHQLPFPSHKRPCMETSNNDTLPHMALALEKLAHPTFLHQLHSTGTSIVICSQVVHTHESPGQPSSLLLGNMRILGLTKLTIMIPAHLTSHTMYYHLPTTIAFCHLMKNDYYHPTQPAVPHWVNRGGTTQKYEDDFPGDYVDDY